MEASNDRRPVQASRHLRLRVYAKVRRFGRRLADALRPISWLGRLLAAMWPVSLVCLAVGLCLLLPGLASSQTVEAMLEYAGASDQPSIQWARLLVTSLVTFYLGNVLAVTAERLLDKDSARPTFSHRSIRVTSRCCRWFPTLAVATAFYWMQRGNSDWLYPYRLMASILCAAHIFYGHLFCRLGATRFVARVRAALGRWLLPGYATRLLFGAALVVLFAAPDKDRWLFLPISAIWVSQALGPVNIMMLFLAMFAELAAALIVTGRFLKVPVTLMVVCSLSGSVGSISTTTTGSDGRSSTSTSRSMCRGCLHAVDAHASRQGPVRRLSCHPGIS